MAFVDYSALSLHYKSSQRQHIREYVCLVSVKLYLQKQMVGPIWPADSSLPTPSLTVLTLDTKSIQHRCEPIFGTKLYVKSISSIKIAHSKLKLIYRIIAMIGSRVMI